MEINIANAFKEVVPSLNLIPKPIRLLDINIEDRLLFPNKDSFFWLVYPNMVNKPEFKKIEGRITTRKLINEIVSAYEVILRFSATTLEEIIIKDILCDYTKRQFIVVLL